MKRIKIKQVDAFTRTPFAGNPAGVVTSPSGLTVRQMKQIARELNLSETAFILPSKNPSADMHIRWFTPSVEVDLCGHATIASFFALAEEGKYGMTRVGKFKFKVETKSGVLPIEVNIPEDFNVSITFGLPVPEYTFLDVDKDEICTMLRCTETEIDTELNIAKDNFQMVIPFTTRESVYKLKPDYELVKQFSKKYGVNAVTPVTLDTVDEGSSYHSRCFAPLMGVNEDPVTGSSVGPLGVYMHINKNKKTEYIAEQGDCLDRRGRVIVKVKAVKDKVEELCIIGHAVTVMSGEIIINND